MKPSRPDWHHWLHRIEIAPVPQLRSRSCEQFLFEWFLQEINWKERTEKKHRIRSWWYVAPEPSLKPMGLQFGDGVHGGNGCVQNGKPLWRRHNCHYPSVKVSSAEQASASTAHEYCFAKIFGPGFKMHISTKDIC